ncbi:GSCOCG00012587001-RA-CDS [Cotesia congregata]|nr:GSCOCG00012587001-RA-CDS [Cotesia congregata]
MISIRFAVQNRDEFDDLDIQAYLLQELRDCPITITLCEGNVEVPDESLRTKIIEENHNSLIGGHKGVVKTYWRIRERYYWPGMKDTIYNYNRACEICQKNKLTRIKTKHLCLLQIHPLNLSKKLA